MDAATMKLRRKWLILTLILPFFPLGAAIFLYQLVKTPERLSEIPVAVGYLILSIPSLWILIYCAYKKFGTRFLMFHIICGCTYFLLTIPLELFAAFKSEELLLLNQLKPINYSNLFFYNKLLLASIIWILVKVIDVYYLVLSYKLRKVNKDIQRCLAMSSQEYEEGVNLFQQATDLDDLNKKFYFLSSKHPGQLVVALDKVYKEKKLFFEKEFVSSKIEG